MNRNLPLFSVLVSATLALPLQAQSADPAETGPSSPMAGSTGPKRVVPQAYPDFTFKRITVQPGAVPRDVVQIDPVAQAAYIAGRPNAGAQVYDPLAEPVAATVDTAAALPGAGQGAAKGDWDWFWTGVSPTSASAGPSNMAQALRVLDSSPDLPEPRLQVMQNLARAYGRHIMTATIGTDVSPALVLALISVESAGLATAQSHKGAQGLMQLIPDTAKRFGVEDANDPAQNIKGGVAYLEWLLDKFDRDPILALAGYNAGEGAVIKHGGVPPYAETRAYVPKVLTAWRVARGICQTPPELVSDGCVFIPS